MDWHAAWLWLLEPRHAVTVVVLLLMVGGAIGAARELLALLGLWRKRPHWRK